MTRFSCLSFVAALVLVSSGTAMAQPAKKHDPKEHALWFAKYSFDYAKKECDLITADPAPESDKQGGTIAKCLSKDGKDVLTYRLNLGATMFDVPKIELISTIPK